MTRVAEGDRLARAEVARRLVGRVQRLSRALLHDPNDAKDASQVSLLEVLRCAGSFRGESSLEHWADRITVRASLRWVGKDRRTRRKEHLSDLAQTQSAPEAGTSRVLLEECLANLPEAQRTTLLLRCAFEYSVPEVAELTGVPVNTVKDRLLRARAALRRWVGEGTGDLIRSQGRLESSPALG